MDFAAAGPKCKELEWESILLAAETGDSDAFECTTPAGGWLWGSPSSGEGLIWQAAGNPNWPGSMVT